jgi:iron complex outermembrane receptor protein
MLHKTVRGLIATVGLQALVAVARGATADAPAAESDVPAAESSGGLQEVVVTAQKRTESLQKTAAAVTVLPAETLIDRGITDLREAQMVVPAARFQKQGNSTQMFVRGVGANLDGANIAPNVAFNLNGAYVPKEATTAFYDLASMEVLPGPQGTLYGRSAVGGTINVNFARPSHNWEGDTSLELGNYSLAHVTVAQNLPLSDQLAVRLAGDYVNRDGYMKSGSDSQNDPSGRVGVLYDPNDALSVYVWTSYTRKMGHPMNFVNKGTDPNTGAYSENAFLNDDPYDDLRHGFWAQPALLPAGQPTSGKQFYKSFLTGAQIDWRLGFGTLTYIPSYSDTDTHPSVYWLGVVPADLEIGYRMSSHELRLSGESGPLSWLGGVYVYDERGRDHLFIFGRTVNDIRESRLKGESLFGQLTYSATDRLRFTAGGRYSLDDRDAHGYQGVNPGQPDVAFVFSNNYSHVDWKLSTEFDLADDVMAYAAVQTGYAPGTYNSLPSSATFDNKVKPTKLTAYSAGLKSRFLDHRLQVNPEVFYYDYRDLVTQLYDVNAFFNPLFNAQKVQIYGSQVDMLWSLTSNDQLNLNLAYTHARNKEFVTPQGQDYSGLATSYSPDYTLIGGFQHRFDLPSGSILARLDARYESHWWADYAHNRGVEQKGTAKSDALLKYESNRNWALSFYIKNITNEAVMAASAAAGIPGPGTVGLEAPRTYGVRFEMNYGKKGG